MAIAIAIAALVLFSIAFQLLTPWWLTPLASNWKSIDTALDVTMWVCGFFFIVLNVFLAFAIWRYRHRQGHRAHYDPESVALERRLTVWTAVGIAALLAPGLIAWKQFVTVPKDAAVVEAVGQQWQWSFRFPGKDGVLGTANSRQISPDNPFGLNPADPFGRDDILVEGNEVHLPRGRPVKVVLRSKDVLHDFFVPQIRARMDMVPGMVTYFWFTPTRTGKFEILCAELCGTGHYTMRGALVIDDEPAFQAWLNQQPTFAQLMAQAGQTAPAGSPVKSGK
ncbi:MAG TPA: cytochrome c oxidase subunit II [Phenylobacterium sp.]|uniref:cytochrome c oxidase subunit II n=1 Tax=Phenylobacterium sp. TaxID=1871053 RepID=UPI002B4A6B93|nr:cytochrome c oxidase subunit II [Phenylobacterium sp.]HKR89007.1 cytochrome c oxidase subunit II [Phenylobacterium sp.]